MKTIFNIAILCFLFCACNQEKSTKYSPFSAQQETDRGEIAIVYGKISNLQVYPHVNEVVLTLPDFSVIGEVHVSSIDSSGEFSFEIYPIVPREFSLTPIEDRLMIAPGDSLYIEHDFSDITNSQFSGSAAVWNRQIAQFRNEYLGRFSFNYEMPYMNFKDSCDKQLEVNFEKLNAFQREHSTSDIFNNWAEKQIRLDYYSALFQFPSQHFIRTQEEFPDYDAYYKFLPELENTIDETMILYSYFPVMERFNMLKMLGPEPVPKRNLTFSEALSLDLLSSISNDSFFSQFVVSTQISIGTKANITKIIDDNEKQVNKMITDPFLRTALQSEYNRIKKYKSNPKVYSDAVMGRDALESHGLEFSPKDSFNIIKQIINDNQDEVLYIDIWAPWCSPCIAQMPESKILSNYFSDKPVTFVYLNIGGTDEQWKETISKYELSGIHIYLKDEEWRDVMKRFNVKGIPYYLLFNKEGVLVDFGNHLRPTIPETKIIIEKLLE